MSKNTMKCNRFTLFWAIGLGLNLTLIIGLYFTNISIEIEYFSDIISLPLFTIIPGVLVLLGIWAITKSENINDISKKSLIFLVIAFGCWFAAEQTWNLYEHVLDIDPYPSIADVFYLAAPIFMLYALILFLKSFKHQISKKIMIFASIISIIVLIPTVIVTYTSGVEDEPFEIFVALLYPIIGAITLVPTIIAISHTILNKKSFFWIGILMGLIVLFIADTTFLFLVINDTYFDGHPVDILFISSYTIWTFMIYYIINNAKYQKEPERKKGEKYGISYSEKYGVIATIIIINVIVGVSILGMNYFAESNLSDKDSTSYFSWMLVMIVAIFSSIIVLLNSKLNRVLQKRTRVLEKTTEDLVKAERFSAIGTLASRLAHDLRNPLGVIMTSNSIIKKKVTDEQIVKNTEYISRSIDRMEHQINNVLDFVRVKPLKIEKISVQELIDDCLDGMKIPKDIVIKKP